MTTAKFWLEERLENNITQQKENKKNATLVWKEGENKLVVICIPIVIWKHICDVRSCSCFVHPIMTHQCLSSKDIISSVLIYTSETFHEFYSGLYDTSQLVYNAKNNFLNKFHTDLESDHSKCNRYKLLMAMLDFSHCWN